ncbi:MAG: bifunctional 3,4-dihydroxy-2-butanone-4-phosphate synthase/GTP cyclohydrolase II [Flavobacteriales bacterium]|nr:bifunctional 3,4-dihydroxy-2-butanone-4-phosphate synthase/GTP cyclohydrolase II [Flavobacteriales bacterium]
MTLNTIPEAIEEIKKGKIVIVVDDENRENEGDFVVAAEKITPEIINFMATKGKGLICAPISEERCKELDLELMTGKNTALHQTAFTISVDLIGENCTTGISSEDRSKTIKALVNDKSKPEDFARPGHIFPLKSLKGGVLRRAGHTEAGTDLAKLAGLKPAAVIVEIINPDGKMARLPDLIKIAKKLNIKIISIEDLIKYRIQKESLIEKTCEVKLPTKYGDFRLLSYKQTTTNKEHLALVKGNWEENEEVLVRVHSSCFTGDVLGSLRCDCGDQLQNSLEMIQKKGKGVVVYMNQEGRGIGLSNKIKAYELQEKGMDTVDANIALGFKADKRDYGIGAQILRDLNIKKINLISNNPKKRAGLKGYGIKIIKNIPINTCSNEHNDFYLKTKRDKMGHDLKLKNE